MAHHNINDFFNLAELFLLRLGLFILLLLALAKVVWSEAAPFLSKVFRHFETNFPHSSAMRTGLRHLRRAMVWPIRYFMAKHWAIERYKGFLITASAVPNFATGFEWYSQGTIFRAGRLGSIVEVKRLEGPIFNSKEEAEQHGLQLCKDWIDKRP